MPAALCGVVGLKPTFARVPHAGWVFIFVFSCLNTERIGMI